MATIRPPLSRNQIAFLEKNFVIYDPLYRECYTEFSRLENCRVILIGELHHSPTLVQIQDQFLELIMGNEPACLLAEGLTPGQMIKAKERWPHAAESLTMRGADNRHEWTASQFLAWEQLRQQISKLEAEDQEQTSNDIRKIATCLNQHFVSQGCRGIDRANRVFVVPKEIGQSCDQLLGHLTHSKEQRDQKIESLADQLNAMTPKTSKRTVTVVESNLGFAQEIIKATCEFNRVIGIWGKAHFICDDELIAALNKARLSYVILLPNKHLEDQAYDECSWSHGTMPHAELNYGVFTAANKMELTTCKVPKIFQSLFHPGLQTIFIHEKEEPIILDIEKLTQLYQPEKKLEFSANQPIHIEHIPLRDFHKLEELLNVSEGERTLLSSDRSIPVINCIISILNNILMLRRLRVDLIEMDGTITYSLHISQNKPVLELSSDRPFKLTLVRSETLFGHASHFFREMKRLGLQKFSLSPNETLFFYDLSLEQRDSIIKTPNEVIPWINSKLPPQTVVDLQGRLTVASATIRLAAKRPETEIQGLCFKTQTGLTIEIK